MDHTQELFLQALGASLKDEKVAWEMELQQQDWESLFRLAEQHHVLPMIYEAVYDCPSARQAPPPLFMLYKRRVMQMVMLQTMKTSEFLMLYKYLNQAGIRPLVVKGIICRSLYPKSDYRMSGDEDILIPAEQFSLCHKMMMDYGMQLSNPDQDIETDYEVPYGKPGSPIYIELHKSLFPPESDVYGNFNRFFDKVSEQAIEVSIDGSSITTMEYTDHLFYLICHAFKHFLHSGFGLRQVCDIILFANKYGSEIDWERVLKQCQEIHAEVFTAALFDIGERYLDFDREKAGFPEKWRELAVDSTDLLEDLLSAGVYGGADMSRKHSSSITLNAVAAEKQGKKGRGSVIKTVFPSGRSLEKRYPYLQKYPFLLPAAWIQRIATYGKELNGRDQSNNAMESIRIGNQRVELLRKYKIME